MKQQLCITDFYKPTKSNPRILIKIHKIIKIVQNKLKGFIFKKHAQSQSLITDYFPTIIKPFSKTQTKLTKYLKNKKPK